MQLGRIDLDPEPEYLLSYRDKRKDTMNTWTLGESALKVNYKQMKESGDVEFLGIYKKLTDGDLLDVMTR